jgi:hypothetical protein
MDLDTWWGLIERARAAVGDRADDRDLPDDPLVPAVVDLLVALEPAGIIAFGQRYAEVWWSAYRWPLWVAAYLIEGGCGDDGFMDFRAGLVLQGRRTFERAVADPDSLAEHPVVRRMANEGRGWLGCEAMQYATGNAYQRRVGETDSYEAALAAVRPEEPALGEQWNPEEDADETRRRLPRLAALFL